MSYDEDKALQKILDHLYKLALEHTYNNAGAEEIVRDTGLSLRAVKEQGNKSILQNWVIVDARDDAGEWIIRINQSGIKKLNELENRGKIVTTSKKPSEITHTKHTDRPKLGKIGIIPKIIAIFILPTIVFFGLIGGGILDPLLFFCQTGVNDKTYTDCDLGFQISRPNDLWDFDTDLAQIKEERSGTPPEKYYLGGIYVATTNLDHVLIAVFDDEILKEQSIEEWINNFKVIAEKEYNATTIENEISTDGDWGIYSGEFLDEDGLSKGEQILEVENGKVYFRQKMGLSPEIMPETQKEDFEFILNSYSKFQTIYQIIFPS